MLVGFLVVISLINTVLLIWNILVLNGGFEMTNSNLNSYKQMNEVLVKKCDEIVSKYKAMVKSIQDDK